MANIIPQKELDVKLFVIVSVLTHSKIVHEFDVVDAARKCH
jgi:hypothetical protein